MPNEKVAERILELPKEPRAGWREEAACRGAASDTFFPERYDGALYNKKETLRLSREAKEICASCGVVDECFAFAILSNQSEGVWGGVTANERAKYRRRLRSAGLLDSV